MKFFPNYIIAALVLVLAFSLAAPICRAQPQTRVLTRVLNLDSDGGYLGIEMKEVTAENMSTYKLKKERGVVVNSVVKGSPAESAKLQDNDVILEFADNSVWSTQQFSRLVKETPSGRTVELGISRDGKRMDVTVEIGSRDATVSRAGGPRDSFQEFFPRFFGEGMPEPPEGMIIQRMAGKPRLGVTLQPLTDQLGEYFGVPGGKGALVSSVDKDSPSAGKLDSGDVITEANGKPMNNPEDLTSVARGNDGGTITLKVIRNKKEITVVINLPSEENEKGYKL